MVSSTNSNQVRLLAGSDIQQENILQIHKERCEIAM